MTLLGLTATSTYANWKNGKTGTIPRDTLERISYLFNIDDKLRHNNNSEHDINLWLRCEQKLLDGHSPLARMLAGNVIDIYWIKQNLNQLDATAHSAPPPPPPPQ